MSAHWPSPARQQLAAGVAVQRAWVRRCRVSSADKGIFVRAWSQAEEHKLQRARREALVDQHLLEVMHAMLLSPRATINGAVLDLTIITSIAANASDRLRK